MPTDDEKWLIDLLIEKLELWNPATRLNLTDHEIEINERRLHGQSSFDQEDGIDTRLICGSKTFLCKYSKNYANSKNSNLSSRAHISVSIATNVQSTTDCVEESARSCSVDGARAT